MAASCPRASEAAAARWAAPKRNFRVAPGLVDAVAEDSVAPENTQRLARAARCECVRSLRRTSARRSASECAFDEAAPFLRASARRRSRDESPASPAAQRELPDASAVDDSTVFSADP